MTPVHQWMSWEVKSCAFVRNKSFKKSLKSFNFKLSIIPEMMKWQRKVYLQLWLQCIRRICSADCSLLNTNGSLGKRKHCRIKTLRVIAHKCLFTDILQPFSAKKCLDYTWSTITEDLNCMLCKKRSIWGESLSCRLSFHPISRAGCSFTLFTAQ